MTGDVAGNTAVAASPEVPKIRYQRLRQVFNKALSQSIAKFQDYEKLSSCFPEYAATHEGKVHLQNCEKQVTEFWTELCHREFDEIMKERHVKEKLDELDVLIQEARARQKQAEKIGASPSRSTSEKEELSIANLSVDQIIQANLHTQRQETLRQINERIKIVDQSNAELEEKLRTMEADLEKEYVDLNETYTQYTGQMQKQPLDKMLVQSLQDMLLESRED